MAKIKLIQLLIFVATCFIISCGQKIEPAALDEDSVEVAIYEDSIGIDNDEFVPVVNEISVTDNENSTQSEHNEENLLPISKRKIEVNEKASNLSFMIEIILFMEVTGICIFLIWLFRGRGILKDWESHKKIIKDQFQSSANSIKGVQSSVNSFQNQANSSNTKIAGQISDIKKALNEMKEAVSRVGTTLATQHYEVTTKIESQTQTITEGATANKKEIVSSMTALLQSLFREHTETGKTQFESTKNMIESVCSKIEALSSQENDNSQSHSRNLDEIKLVWKQHLDTVKPFELLLSQTEILYGNLLKEELKIAEQEKSLSAMVARHAHIAELTDELNKTAKDVYELMRLYLMNSIVEMTDN